MWKSPIEISYDEILSKFEDGVFREVQNVGIKVDKEELIKALRYDRGQYEKGFIDGHWARDMEIVRCKDCKEYGEWLGGKICMRYGSYYGNTKPDDFCSRGERRDDAEIH